MKKSSLIILFFLVGLGNTFAQKTIEAIVSRSTVGVYERFTLQIITNSDCPVKFPDFGGLEVLGIPSEGHKTNMDLNTGTVIKENSWIYELRSKETGTYTISSASMDCNGEVYKTDPIKITVTEDQQATEDQDFFMRLTTNKPSVFVGEPFVTTLIYYAKAQPEDVEAIELGNAEGVWRGDLSPNRRGFKIGEEVIDGMKYYTIALRRELCYAQRAGKIVFEPYYASLIFSQGFLNRFRKESQSNRLEIDVKGIPDNSPPGYNGLVGEFAANVEISKTDVKIGEAIDIKVVIEGKGNFQALDEVKLDVPEGFEHFEPEIKDETLFLETGIEGKIEYNFVLVPKRAGDFEIPGYSLDYFDLLEKKMKTISSEGFTISVANRGEGTIVTPSDHATNFEDGDIRYIHEGDASLFTQDDFLFGSWTYYGLLLGPIGCSFLLIFFYRKRENLTTDEKLKIQQKKAVKIAQNDLKDVREHIEKGQEKEALKLLQNALINFFKQKFNVGLSELSQRSIEKRLEESQVDPILRLSFNTIWNAIEMGQYAPIAHDNLVQTVNGTEQLIQELDKKI